MIVNSGITASKEKSGGLNLRGGNEDFPLFDWVDSKYMINAWCQAGNTIHLTTLLPICDTWKKMNGQN